MLREEDREDDPPDTKKGEEFLISLKMKVEKRAKCKMLVLYYNSNPEWKGAGGGPSAIAYREC